LIPTWYTIFI